MTKLTFGFVIELVSWTNSAIVPSVNIHKGLELGNCTCKTARRGGVRNDPVFVNCSCGG